MTKAAKRDDATPDMFDVPMPPAPVGGSLDYTKELNHVLSAAISASGRSRYEIAGRMSELTGQDITKSMLDSWTADSKQDWRFPFEFAAAFEAACVSTCLQELLGRKRGSRILVGQDALLAEWGRVQMAKADLAEKEKALKQRMVRVK
jgi:hypothetical protein